MYTEIFIPDGANNQPFTVEFVALLPPNEEISVERMVVRYKGKDYELWSDTYGEDFFGTIDNKRGMLA